ncbi:hypothetical protein ACMFMG_011063 [Clarireedia jacksonii]
MSPVPWKALKQVDPTAAVIVSQPPNDTTIAKKFRVQLPPGSFIIVVGLQSALKPNPTSQEDNNACHGISGDYWAMSRKKLGDDKKIPKGSPDCAARFQNAVIDGYDGGDKINNPHNYKFGSILTSDSISDIEATGLALGIISTIISIIKATTKVYEAVKNEADLPKNFKKSATKLPLISKFLQDTERYIEAADEATKTAFTPTLKNYKAQAIQLRGLFEKVIPEEGK